MVMCEKRATWMSGLILCRIDSALLEMSITEVFRTCKYGVMLARSIFTRYACTMYGFGPVMMLLGTSMGCNRACF